VADKLGRNYNLQIQTQSGSILTIAPPFTIEFDITRNILTSANVSSVRIYNISQNNRNQIRKNVNDYGDLRQITLMAGYGINLPVVFTGNITQAWSVREGVNVITQIESYDGGFAFANGITNEQFPAGTPQSTIIASLAGSLPGVSIGAIGNYPGTISRANSYSGTTTDLLRELTGGGFFIDNGKANCLGDSECLQGEIQVINSASGLLGTPVREQTILNFDMLFEPRLVIGQQIQLQSITEANFNGFYKVISIKHRGMISEAVCGDAITSVGLFYGTQALTTVPTL
jgi:hypothetical protein